MVEGSSNLVGKGSLLEKLGVQAGSMRRGIQFEGAKYTLGDFTLFVGQATNMAGSKEFLGVVTEVEYLPLHNVDVAQPMLQVRPHTGLIRAKATEL